MSVFVQCYGDLERFFLTAVLLLMLVSNASASTPLVHHDLQVKLQPDQGRLSVIDDVQLPPQTASQIEFSLHGGLRVTAEGAELKQLQTLQQGRLVRYQLSNLPANRRIRLRYQGKITSNQPQGPFGMPSAVLSSDGIYLDAASNWYAVFQDYPWLTFSLQVKAPAGWEIISQGKREGLKDGFRYSMPHPQDDIYLLGGRFQRYQQQLNDIELEVYLLKADQDLAQRYLRASADYVRYYSERIGAYPYAKFAVVENRWQTGYGMPSFTLLGSRVIRLPFILHTSLPHEILHNWWGNGVYIDFSSGNWSEGLTAYLSDHLDSEQRGEASAYRRKALERYANFAARERDFALAEFRSRHDEASQAVGYSKSLMVFHMLRQQAGDAEFDQRIRQFWQRYRFQPASYINVIETLFSGDKSARETFIEQWLARTGAPKLALGEIQIQQHGKGYRLRVEINQTQSNAPYRLQVPLEVRLSDTETPVRQVIELTGRRTVISLDFASRPEALTLDPTYDVFRLLDPAETPSSLGRLFGARKQLLILPGGVKDEQRQAWQDLATAWAQRYGNVELVEDSELTDLPADRAVWILGWENRFLLAERSRFNSDNQQITQKTVTFDQQQFNSADSAVVLLDPDNSRPPLGFVGAQDPDVIAALARKLPHYTSYGRLVFELPTVSNVIKQSLPVKVSSLRRQLKP